MTRVLARGLFAFASVGLALVACGDSADRAEVELEEVPPGTDAETTTTTAGDAGGAADLQACLEDAGLELAAEGDQDLPITASEGSGPPIVNGAPGTGVRAASGAAVFFVYDSAAEAADAASLLGASSDGTVVIVADGAFPSAAQDAIVGCAGDDQAAPPEPGGDAASEVESCISSGGVEIADRDATDLVISGQPSAGLPVIDGVQGIGARSSGLTAVFFVYETPEIASQAAQSFLDSSDVVQNAPRVTVVAFDTVLFAMDTDFPQDAQVVILDCAAPR